MGCFSESKEERFIAESADKLVHSLAHHCATGAKEVADALGEHVPPNLTVDTLFLFLFSLRGTMEALGVERKFGKRAYQSLMFAIERLYQSKFPEVFSKTGPFSQSLMRDVVVSMSKSPDPREWIRIHAVRSLQTRDPEDEMLHLCLAKVFTNGQPIAAVVEQAA